MRRSSRWRRNRKRRSYIRRRKRKKEWAMIADECFICWVHELRWWRRGQRQRRQPWMFYFGSVFFKVSSASERRNRKTKTNDIKSFLEYWLGKHMAEMRRVFVRHTTPTQNILIYRSKWKINDFKSVDMVETYELIFVCVCFVCSSSAFSVSNN